MRHGVGKFRRLPSSSRAADARSLFTQKRNIVRELNLPKCCRNLEEMGIAALLVVMMRGASVMQRNIAQECGVRCIIGEVILPTLHALI
jgi:hypothetical protein